MMFHIAWNSVWLTPALLGALTFAASALPAPSSSDMPLQKMTDSELKDGVSPTAAADVSTMEKVITYGENTGKTRIGQVTSVSQLTDVKPTDWAFQALQSLVERYGCIVGYPDKKYRGNQALTRYEFAAGLNACLDRVNELIAAGTADLVKKEDLDALKRLQEEFAAELAELRGKVDALEARTDLLEKQQFSTTTKLVGEAIFALAGAFGNDRALTGDQQRAVDAGATPAVREARRAAFLGDSRGVQDNIIGADRVRLALDTSFSGRDRLRTQLQARNITPFNSAITGTNMTRLGFDGSNNNSIELRRLEYRFPLTPLTTVFIGGGTNDGLEYNDSIPTLNTLLDSSSAGSISRFGRYNPILRATTGTGIIINQKFGREYSFGEKFTLSAGYLVPTADAQSPVDDRGLFNGSYSALGQLVFQPTPAISIGVTYVHGYYNTGTGISGGTGSAFADNPFNSANAINPAAINNVPTETNNFGAAASIRLGPGFVISGWGGYTKAEARRTVNTAGASGSITGQGSAADPVVRRGDEATIWNWAVTLAFPDLFKEGNLGGIVFGMPPRVTASDYGANNRPALGARREDRDTSYHIEGFYRFKLSDNVAITPGVIVILNPEHNDSNDTEYVGTVRTTFTF